MSIQEILSTREQIGSFLNGSADYAVVAQTSSASLAQVVAAALFERATRLVGSHTETSKHRHPYSILFTALTHHSIIILSVSHKPLKPQSYNPYHNDQLTADMPIFSQTPPATPVPVPRSYNA